MLRMEVKSRLSPREAIERAVKFFGPAGYGMKVRESSEDGAAFEGGGGGVVVNASPNQKGSTVEIESQEWDFQAKEFLRQIK
jgi:hypothetical protein